jgi:hypothetical protein
MTAMRFPIILIPGRSHYEKALHRRTNYQSHQGSEAGVKVGDIYRSLGISVGTFYNWRSEYAVMETNKTKRMKDLEFENVII